MRKKKNSKDSSAFSRVIIVLSVLLAVSLFSLLYLYHSSSGGESVKEENRVRISFSWWGNDPRHVYTLKGIDLFEEKNPGIEVNPSYGVWDGFEYHNEVVMRSHTEADVMQINYAWLSTYSQDGEGYLDLSTLGDEIDLSQFSREDLDYGTMNGKLNALPIAYNMPVFFYNQDILDRYGLEAPGTWDELSEDAAVLSKDGIYLLGGVKKHIWLMLLAWYEQNSGKDSFAQDGTCLIDQQGFEDILDFYRKLLDEKVIMPVDEFGQQFVTQKQAGILCWISDVDRYCDPLDEKGISLTMGRNLSRADGGCTGWRLKPATMLAVSSITDQPEAAGKLLDYLLNDPDYAVLQGTEKGMPVSMVSRKAVEDSGSADRFEAEATDALIARQDQLETIIPQMENDAVISAFKEEADKYLYGREEKEICAGNIVREIREATAAK